MKFSVHVMAPRPKQRPPDTRTTSTSAPFSSGLSATSVAHAHTLLKTLAVPIGSESAFDDLWRETEKRFRRGFDKDKIAGMQFSHLLDAEGAYITASDTVGSMYREDAPPVERQLWMYMKEIDREDTIPIGSELRPKGFRKRRWTDMDEAEQTTVKRRRAQEQRYGAPVDELDPDTPIVSREVGIEGGVVAGTGVRSRQKESVRVDADGFKIPARPNKEPGKTPARLAQQSPIVLVHSSQPEDDDASREPSTPDSSDGRSNGDIPPSAQRSVPSQPDQVDPATPSETPPRNAFQLLAGNKTSSKSKSANRTKSSGKSAYTRWMDEEDEVILEGMREGWNSSQIAAKLPGRHRSGNAIRNRKLLLKVKHDVGPSAEKIPCKRGQILEFASSPPVPSGSTGPQSSPCDTARSATSPPGHIAYVRLTRPQTPTGKCSPEPSPTQHVPERVHVQTATPPTSNASETSDTKLRAPAAGSTNASRLRKARTRGKPPFGEARLHEAHGEPTNVVVNDAPDEQAEAGAEVDTHLANDVTAASRELSSDQRTADLSVAPDVVENRQDVSNTADNQVDPPAEEEIPTIQALPDKNVPAQPTPEITLPKRKKNSTYNDRTDKQRWKEALELAKGDRSKAKEVFIVNLNKENMFDAVIADDQPEIERLKAQRRRREREIAILKGLPPPRRRMPTSFSSALSSKPDFDDADEEVVREDDWTTDEEESRQKAAQDEQEEEMSDEGAIYSDDDEDFLDVEAQLDGPRIAELEDSPPPVVTSSDVVNTADTIDDAGIEALPAQPGFATCHGSTPKIRASSDASSHAGKKMKDKAKKRRKSRTSDTTPPERLGHLRAGILLSRNVSETHLSISPRNDVKAVIQDDESETAKIRRSSELRVADSSIESDDAADEMKMPLLSRVRSSRLSPLDEEAVFSVTKSPVPQAKAAAKSRMKLSSSSASRLPKKEPKAPGGASMQPKVETPLSKHSQQSKKKLFVTPKKKITREEAVAAHLAECKRKEALYLNSDDDDDDTSSARSSS